MCLRAGQGSPAWHSTIFVSVLFPTRTLTQRWPLITGAKKSVRIVTTVTLRVAALCTAILLVQIVPSGAANLAASPTEKVGHSK